MSTPLNYHANLGLIRHYQQHQVQLSSSNGIQLEQHQNRLLVCSLKTLLGKQLGDWHKTLTSEGRFRTAVWEGVDTQALEKGEAIKEAQVVIE